MKGILPKSFQVGDKVVYPNHGVGVIEQVATRSNGFLTQRFYMLNIRASSLKVTVPCENATVVGLRALTATDDIARILAFLGQSGESKNGDWKERHREHTDKLKAGTLMEVAEVMKSLLLLHRDKGLSAREGKLLERTRYLLVNEISHSRACSESEVDALMLDALLKAKLTFPDVIGDEDA